MIIWKISKVLYQLFDMYVLSVIFQMILVWKSAGSFLIFKAKKIGCLEKKIKLIVNTAFVVLDSWDFLDKSVVFPKILPDFYKVQKSDISCMPKLKFHNPVDIKGDAAHVL